jgi:Fur family ferric uptake transcriptional regulator
MSMTNPNRVSKPVRINLEAWVNAVCSAWQATHHRLTGPRIRLLRRIASYTTPFSAEQLYADSHQDDTPPGRATVYRTLEQMHSAGWVARIHTTGTETGYIASWPGHLHHLVCTDCSAVITFEGCGLGDLLANLSHQTSFAIDGHLLQIYGRCAKCQGAGAAQALR